MRRVNGPVMSFDERPDLHYLRGGPEDIFTSGNVDESGYIFQDPVISGLSLLFGSRKNFLEFFVDFVIYLKKFAL
jgi:hypothetical protein